MSVSSRAFICISFLLAACLAGCVRAPRESEAAVPVHQTDDIGVVVDVPDYPEYQTSDELMFRARVEVVDVSEEQARRRARVLVLLELQEEVLRGFGSVVLGGTRSRISAPVLPQDKIRQADPISRRRADGTWRVTVACEVPRVAVREASECVRPSPYDLYRYSFGAENFPAEISGMRSRYADGERSRVVVTPARDAFLSVFWIDRNGRADVVLSDVPVKKGVPFSDAYPWRFWMLDSRTPEERNRIIFFLSSKSVPFSRPLGYRDGEPFEAEHVDEWISSFSSEECAAYIFSFSVVSEKSSVSVGS